MKILISPYSMPLSNRKTNAKNYPWWSEVVKILKEKGDYVVQLGLEGEAPIWGCDEFVKKGYHELKTYVNEFDCWISVDNFFHHFCTMYGKLGIVIFSRSDPNIFGHPKNFNLLKNRAYLRPDQYGIWEECPYNADAFVEPSVIIDVINKHFRKGNNGAAVEEARDGAYHGVNSYHN